MKCTAGNTEEAGPPEYRRSATNCWTAPRYLLAGAEPEGEGCAGGKRKRRDFSGDSLGKSPADETEKGTSRYVHLPCSWQDACAEASGTKKHFRSGYSEHDRIKAVDVLGLRVQQPASLPAEHAQGGEMRK